MYKLILSTLLCAALLTARDPDGKLRVIAFGAHPDDCDIRAAGTAALFVQMGHHVKFVSVTNGDAGHGNQMDTPGDHNTVAECDRCRALCLQVEIGVEKSFLSELDRAGTVDHGASEDDNGWRQCRLQLCSKRRVRIQPAK